MSSFVTPTRRRAHGKDTWWVVPSIFRTDYPAAEEINAGFNLAGVLTADYEGITAETPKNPPVHRVCAEEDLEEFGPRTYTAAPLRITLHPQAPADSDGKKAWALLEDGLTGFLVCRPDARIADDVTAGQFVDVFPVQIDRPVPGRSSTGTGGIYIFTAAVRVIGTPAYNQVVW